MLAEGTLAPDFDVPAHDGTRVKLSDHAGTYVICVSCRQCKHDREIDPRTLANILGWNVTLKQACTRLRCSRCQARNFLVEVAFNRKPRGWKSNPS